MPTGKEWPLSRLKPHAMVRLRLADWAGVASIINEGIPFVTVCMQYQERYPGEIWVDAPARPRTVLARFRKDAFAWGDLERARGSRLLAGFRGTIAEVPGLRRLLNDLGVAYTDTPSILLTCRNSAPEAGPAPFGYRLARVDQDNLNLLKRFWSEAYPAGIGDFLSDHEFLDRGFAFMGVHQASGQCVAACAAIAVSRERCDYGLDTDLEHRGRGLGSLCARACIAETLRRGKRPVWITEVTNAASRRVAAKAGLRAAQAVNVIVCSQSK